MESEIQTNMKLEVEDIVTVMEVEVQDIETIEEVHATVVLQASIARNISSLVLLLKPMND